jgi:hypothetical protein
MIAGIGRAADRAGAANDWYADRSAGTQKNESPSSSFELAHVVISAIMSAADKVSGYLHGLIMPVGVAPVGVPTS